MRIASAHNQAPARPSRGFTLVEVLVAIAALSILAVGLALVFKSAGDTASAGKRLSYLNAQSRLLERQLREDFATITRDGYLLIRNEWAQADHSLNMESDGTPDLSDTDNMAPLFEGELADAGRHRRVDEIMFFARGDFVSAREPIHPDVVARSETARIWYGHGKPRRPSFNEDLYYLDPSLGDDVLLDDNSDDDATFGFDDPEEENRNRFASNWVLARHVTLLAQPSKAQVAYPNEIFSGPFGLDPGLVDDSENQVALQPAATNFFRVTQGFGTLPDTTAIRFDVRPRTTSGLVDIITTDLSEIRAVIAGPPCPGGGAGPCISPILPFAITDTEWNAATTIDGGLGTSFVVSLVGGTNTDVLSAQHSWMLDGLPAFSHAPDPEDRIRVRVEPVPPGYAENLAEAYDTSPSLGLQAIRRADQKMLSASNLVPNCTEFIVEWSFGNTYPNDYPVAELRGQTIWHGLKRFVDRDGDGNADDDEIIAWPFDDEDPDFGNLFGFNSDSTLRYPPAFPFVAVDGDTLRYPSGGCIGWPNCTDWFGPELIHGQTYLADIDDGQLMSFFGYFDPTFDPTNIDGVAPADDNGDGVLNNDPNDALNASTMPWAWPKLIRITVSLVDPAEPGLEETFQYVLEIPQGGAGTS